MDAKTCWRIGYLLDVKRITSQIAYKFHGEDGTFEGEILQLSLYPSNKTSSSTT